MYYGDFLPFLGGGVGSRANNKITQRLKNSNDFLDFYGKMENMKNLKFSDSVKFNFNKGEGIDCE